MTEVSILDRFPHIHTGKELELMLCGQKPLSVYSDAVTVLPDENIIPEKMFANHVSKGVILRSQFELQSRIGNRDGEFPVIKYVLFALPSEQWRFQCYRLLITEYSRTGEWNDTCERIEGKLLGYTDEENDIWSQWLQDKRTQT